MKRCEVKIDELKNLCLLHFVYCINQTENLQITEKKTSNL